ncbi:MAG: hypothetical protein A3E01_04110 [Gammaproteobacteria bacterium RIFCSPHIGHO2_12_FULL_63_22]|nr:MAG: hypothetical protein A3E01_04110 [Gammaproteobacteria bacterium RIFCSPHIGHO2_12_FULL_63_22]
MSTIPSVVPTRRSLIKATLLSLVVAVVILVIAVLPAEYGIDPTGVGSHLGLDALASTELKATTESPTDVATVAVAAPSDAALAPMPTAAEPELDAVGQPAKPVDASHVSKRNDAFRSDELTLTLAPGKGGEIKAEMQSGAGFVFQWTASAPVAVDMHGERKDAKEGEYTSYWIEPSLDHGSGSFTAPFEGSHGWYWLNRSESPITVKVQVTGFQKKLFRPGQE